MIRVEPPLPGLPTQAPCYAWFYDPVFPGDSNDREASRECWRRLQQRVPECRLPGDMDMEFKEALQFLRDLAGIDIRVNWPALQAEGQQLDFQADMDLRKVRIQTVLELLLRGVDAGGPPLAYRVANGRVYVSSRSDLASRTETRVYDVRALLDAAADLSPETREAIRLTAQQVVRHPPPGRRRGEMGGILTPDAQVRCLVEQVESDRRRLAAREVMELIRHFVDPYICDGSEGRKSIREMDGLLVVTQHSQAHRQILWLLQALLDALDGHRPAPATQAGEGRGGRDTEGRRLHAEQRRTLP